MSDLLLEIGLEEVPAGFMPDALQALADNGAEALRTARISYERIQALGTPRRLALLVSGMAERQADLEEEVRGPSEKAAYDEAGQPSKALLGFMRGQGVAAEDLIVKERYVYALRKQVGRPTFEVVQELLPALISEMTFPKAMRWGSYDMRYVRPIHWIVALYDQEVIPFSLEMCASGRTSRGHRFLGDAAFDVPSPAAYEQVLLDQWVIVDQDKRRAVIKKQMDALAATVNGHIQEDEALLEEVVHLVEYPTALMGHYDQAFLEMPEELVITPMKEHQRYFPVLADEDGRLLDVFITVRNGDEKHLDIVREGNERVLVARLSDARFFYEEDLKIDLEDNVEKLKAVVFQEKLGSIYDKCVRIETLAEAYADILDVSSEMRAHAQRAAHLCKADLVSNVVMEFPELQGLMGEVYLKAWDKEAALAAQAIREHYHPRFAGDAAPQSMPGTVVALADKMDTIVACFAAGIEPTGSQDPYGLRRQASGVVTILLALEKNISLRALIAKAMDTLPAALQADAQLSGKVHHFFDQRMRTLLKDQGYGAIFLEAVLAAGYDDPYETVQRASALKSWLDSNKEAADVLLTTFKRAHNLSAKSDGRSVDVALFETAAEQALYDALVDAGRKIEGDGSVANVLDVMVSLNPAVDAFFEQVMVMDERMEVRENRLSLLRMFTDFSAVIAHLDAL